MKFRIRWYHFSAPPRKESWHEGPLKVKNNTFCSPFSTTGRKQKAITRPLFVLFEICKRHFVQHMIPIWMVYERSHVKKMAENWKNNEPILWWKRKATASSLCHDWLLHCRLKLFRYLERALNVLSFHIHYYYNIIHSLCGITCGLHYRNY